MRLKKYIIILFLLIKSGSVRSQSLDLERISSSHNLGKILSCKRLSYNYAPHVKNIYVLYLEDNKVCMYYKDDDYISKKFLTHFSLLANSYIGISDGVWKIYQESYSDWILAGEFPALQFDSISILSYNVYGGYKDSSITLLYNSYGEKRLFENKIPYAICNKPIVYQNGIFIVQRKVRENQPNRFKYIDYKTSAPLAPCSFDTILNYPHAFNHYSVVILNGKLAIYSFDEFKLIENDINKYFIVPLYDFPLVFKNNYIALGNMTWKKLRVENAEFIDFKICGDQVLGTITTAENHKHKVDFWEKRLIKKRNIHLNSLMKNCEKN